MSDTALKRVRRLLDTEDVHLVDGYLDVLGAWRSVKPPRSG